MNDPPIVYFDGVCGLCNRFVDFLLRHDRHHRLRFAPLQGRTAAERLGKTKGIDPTTIVLEAEGRMLDRSSAVLGVFHHLGGGWRATGLLRVVPRRLRDLIYDWIARHRYGWFGKREVCRLPTAEERSGFLP
ncbi:MAG TPA: DCC1-like thiol-disulfide oxidoreductase family protein [Gemmatimonadales bacterium]|jgi:predicted DCC family thiol-disulfide oxidoreductase YuxK